MTIDAIQVRFETAVVPPCSVIPTGTVLVLLVIIIFIASCKWLTDMSRK